MTPKELLTIIYIESKKEKYKKYDVFFFFLILSILDRMKKKNHNLFKTCQAILPFTPYGKWKCSDVIQCCKILCILLWYKKESDKRKIENAIDSSSLTQLQKDWNHMKSQVQSIQDACNKWK
jgi:hypothetical protein